MSEWRIFDGEGAAWDSALQKFSSTHIYQSTGWAGYKKAAGWDCVRLTLSGEDGVPCAMVQALFKRVPLLGALLWAPGGPVWKSAPQPDDTNLLAEALRAAAGASYARLFDMSEAAHSYTPRWQRPWVPNGSGASVLVDVTLPREEWLSKVSSKHRYYVRQALRELIQWRIGNDDDQLAALAALTEEMSRLKGAAHQRDQDELRALCSALGTGVLTLIGYMDGQPVTGCQVLRWGEMAIYATAATNWTGRSISAAYAMTAELRDVLRSGGVTTLDFGGIDPGNPAARGVDHFKGGFGGRTVNYAGEQEWASSPLARAMGNLAVRLRRGSGA